MSEISVPPAIDRRNVLKAMVSGAAMLVLGPQNLNSLDQQVDSLANVLPGFSAASRGLVQALMSADSFSGQIPASAVQDLMAAEKKSKAALMINLLPLARTFSHPPISNYRVGAVAEGVSGSLYLGFNVEISGQSLGYAVHGEQAALSSAYMHDEMGVLAIALTAAPCGHCRQFMNELSPDGKIEILVDGAAPMKLSALLPMAFGPKDLGRTEGAFPVKRTNLSMRASQSSSSHAADALREAALEAAQMSYAPYSESNSGVAIATRSGRIFKGSYVENVAFNPSLPPLQTALVQLLLSGKGYSEISHIVLAEKRGSKISQKSATEAVMSAVAPGARLEILTGEVGS